jgi:hypothetical protein
LGADSIPRGTSFVDAYQVWLGKNYMASPDENASLGRGALEGKTQYGTTNNLPKLLSTSHCNVQECYDVVKAAATHKLTEKASNNALCCLNQLTVGIGVLKLKKMLYPMDVLDNDLSIDGIKYCYPGLKEHHKKLKGRGFDLDKKSAGCSSR